MADNVITITFASTQVVPENSSTPSQTPSNRQVIAFAPSRIAQIAAALKSLYARIDAGETVDLAVREALETELAACQPKSTRDMKIQRQVADRWLLASMNGDTSRLMLCVDLYMRRA